MKLPETLRRHRKQVLEFARRRGAHNVRLFRRNILVHGYCEVDTDVVWATVQRDIVPLKNSVLRLLAELDQSPDLW